MDKGCVKTGALVDDLRILVIVSVNPAAEQKLYRKNPALALKAQHAAPFLTDSTVYLIGTSFCHYHGVTVPAQQMLQ